MIEPEIIWHTFCTIATLDDDLRHGSTSKFVLVSRLDDSAGSQRNYKCETCGMEISVNFPPEEKQMTGIHFDVYRDAAGEWRWRMVDGNNRIVGNAGEGYTRYEDAVRAVQNVVNDIQRTPLDKIAVTVVNHG